MKFKSEKWKFVSIAAITCFIGVPLFFSMPAFADDASQPAPEAVSNGSQDENHQSKPAAFAFPSTRPTRPNSARLNDAAPNRKSSFGVGPGVLPPDVRLDPFVIEKYGAAPAVVNFRFGKK